MKITKEQVAKAALGIAIIIPCCVAGKFVGAAVGSIAGGMLAFSAADTSYEWVKNKFTHSTQ